MSDPVSLQIKPTDPVFTIGIAAARLGVSQETLRYYEQQGLVIPYRTPTKRRLYSQKDLEWISCFRNQMEKNKLNVAGVRILLALMPCWDLKPCSERERAECEAYMNYEKVCWAAPLPGSDACKTDDCRTCTVYEQACRAGKLEHIHITIKESTT